MRCWIFRYLFPCLVLIDPACVATPGCASIWELDIRQTRQQYVVEALQDTVVRYTLNDTYRIAHGKP